MSEGLKLINDTLIKNESLKGALDTHIQKRDEKMKQSREYVGKKLYKKIDESSDNGGQENNGGIISKQFSKLKQYMLSSIQTGTFDKIKPSNNGGASGSNGIYSTIMRIIRNPIIELVGSIFLILILCYYLQGVSNTSQTLNVKETYFLNLCLKIWGWLLIIVILWCFISNYM
jgi:hypothetical protein